jgi:phenylalanyl-tRNA synthetase beta chain
MKAPLSLIKEYTDIKSGIDQLVWKMTEIGITCESFEKRGSETVLDIEVTPNRPDWLSLVGLAREISIIEKSKFKKPPISGIPSKSTNLPITFKIDSDKALRYTAILLKDVKVYQSPKWLKDKLMLLGQKSINNIVDITNFVMLELGIPLHAFDYDSFSQKLIKIEKSKGGETFKSVDGIAYTLPENALIIRDGKKVVDLCGIKGGFDTGIKNSTKNILLHIPIYSPSEIRKTSQALKLTSDAQYIYERGPDLGGTLNTLKRAVNLMIKTAGGKVASDIFDFSAQNYTSKIIIVNHSDITEIVGAEIEKSQIMEIFEKLEFDPNFQNGAYHLTIPTFRSDIKIKEDIVEEVARFYGYNNLKPTLPKMRSRAEKIPYEYDRDLELNLKNEHTKLGYNEVYNLSLTSDQKLEHFLQTDKNHIKIANPVSKEYEYFRSSLVPGLVTAAKLNTESSVKIFEYNKKYWGTPGKFSEKYLLSALTKNYNYRELKSMFDRVINLLRIKDVKFSKKTKDFEFWHPNMSYDIFSGNKLLGSVGTLNPKVLINLELFTEIYAYELDVESLSLLQRNIVFEPIPKYPPQIEDITIEVKRGEYIGDIITKIKNTHKFIDSVKLIDLYTNKATFKITYVNPEGNLSGHEVSEIRKLIVKSF